MIQKTQKSTPCENCSDRALYCHATCEDYLAWCKKRNELKKLIFQEKMEISNYLEFRRSGVEKRNRKSS